MDGGGDDDDAFAVDFSTESLLGLVLLNFPIQEGSGLLADIADCTDLSSSSLSDSPLSAGSSLGFFLLNFFIQEGSGLLADIAD